MAHQAVMNWSGGKDSSLCLHRLLKRADIRVNRLVTTVNKAHNRVSMHGLRTELLKRQAAALELPLQIIELPAEPSMDEYNAVMDNCLNGWKEEGITHSVFGDIFLEDLRAYRESRLEGTGIAPKFPLWKKDTRKLAREFIELGFKAILVCVDAQKLGKEFAGRFYDDALLKDLPEGVDPCGENGEFHTFVYDGPCFDHPISFQKQEIAYRSYPAPEADSDRTSSKKKESGFWFQDLVGE